jgi:nitric oxide reductase NorD protein
MEEQVGALWHRLITRVADTGHRAATVRLGDIAPGLGLFFRALGGDGALQIEAAEATAWHSRRGWLQRLAGVGTHAELAWRDERSLRLPPAISAFDDAALNRDLYFWLTTLAAGDARDIGGGDWFTRSQALSRRALQYYPGLTARYRRLCRAHIAARPALSRLRADEARREQAIRSALLEPGSVASLPVARRLPAPVLLWLHPAPPAGITAAGAVAEPDGGHDATRTRKAADLPRRRAGYTAAVDGDDGLVTVRMENIFSWGEYLHVDRASDDEDDLQKAEAVARDLDQLALSRDRSANGASLRFDLDLPAAAEDDLVLGDGIRLPEWDWRAQRLLADRCRVVPLLSRSASAAGLPPHLATPARRLRRQFQALAPARRWYRGQADGAEIDIDAYLRFTADRRAGVRRDADGLYRDLRNGERDLACLLLADLSLSTDTWIDDHHRVIDVIRDSLQLFSEALDASGDRFALYGFSSRKRDPIRFHTLKDFDERYSASIRGRILAIKPGYYTRLGAAVRHATGLLATQPASHRLLLLLTDGKPNDLDQYEGRYGIEDTRHAVRAARRAGLQPFCITIDPDGNDYLPHLFGKSGYAVIRNPAQLPGLLPALYARLAQQV